MSAVITFLNFALLLVLAAAVGIILWRVITVRRASGYICLFLVLPMGQLLMLHSFSFEEWSIYWLFGLLLSLAANILLLVYTILQEKKTAAQEELLETRHRIELEKSHYEAAGRRMEELDKLRKDFGDKLETIASLVRSGENEEVCEGISELAEKIDRTRENPYCSIPVINAVLTEKENECAAAGIALSVDLKLPGALDVTPMHLCSIFSNILDNAITACRGVDKPFIRLLSISDGDYLFIKAVNPSKEPKKAVPGRGYGTRILAELAERYDGSYKSEYENGTFTVLISLLAAGQ